MPRKIRTFLLLNFLVLSPLLMAGGGEEPEQTTMPQQGRLVVEVSSKEESPWPYILGATLTAGGGIVAAWITVRKKRNE